MITIRRGYSRTASVLPGVRNSIPNTAPPHAGELIGYGRRIIGGNGADQYLHACGFALTKYFL